MFRKGTIQLGDDGWGCSAREMLNAGYFESEVDEFLQCLRCIDGLFLDVRGVFFNVDADCCAGGTCTGEADDDSRTVGEQNSYSLLHCYAVVDWVGITELIYEVKFITGEGFNMNKIVKALET